MKGLLIALVLIGLVALPGWPLLFRRSRYAKLLWFVSTLFVVSLGVWSMLHFQFERHFAKLAEAQAVEETRKALVSGTSPRKLADALEELEAGRKFESAGVRTRYRLWYNTVKEAEQ